MKTFKLKPEQEEKDDINQVEVDIEIIEEITKTEPITLEQLDQEIANLDERIANLQVEKVEKVADRVNINREAKKAMLVV